MDQNTIRVTTKVIIHAGNARQLIGDALKAAEAANFDKAGKLLEEAENEINSAHRTQTEVIQSEARGEECKMSLLLTHAQDTLMSAISELNISQRMISMYRKICDRLDQLSKS